MTGSSIWRSWGEMWRRNINAAKQSTQTELISHAGWDIFGSFLRFFFDESMPGRRCVVHDCGNVKNDELGISIHNSPASGSVMLKWKSFVSMHRKNFNPVGQFAVCSEHFTRDCFTLAFPMKGMKRNLKKRTFPTIWKKSSATLSKRSRRTVSGITYLISSFTCDIISSVIVFHDIRAMDAMTIWIVHIHTCVFILFCFFLIVKVKRAFAQ